MKGIEVVVATMNSDYRSLYRRMNIQTDAVIAGQTGSFEYDEFTDKGNKIRAVSTDTKGVGLNRNIGLGLAEGEIILLADDDNVYHEGYDEIVKKAFEELPDADVIAFQMQYIKEGKVIKKDNYRKERRHLINGMSFGAAQIAVRRKPVLREGINFTELFGGGCIYSAGEDSKFLSDCYRAGLHVYSYNATICDNLTDTSTWFAGYNEKFFFDKGAFIACGFSEIMRYPILIYYLYVFRKTGTLKTSEKFRLMREGIAGFKNLKTYEEYSKEKR